MSKNSECVSIKGFEVMCLSVFSVLIERKWDCFANTQRYPKSHLEGTASRRATSNWSLLCSPCAKLFEAWRGLDSSGPKTITEPLIVVGVVIIVVKGGQSQD